MKIKGIWQSQFLFDLQGKISSFMRSLSALPDIAALTGTVSAHKRQIMIGSLIVAGCIVFVGINLFAYLMGRKLSEGKFVPFPQGTIARPVPTPTPRPLMSKGMYNFTVSSAIGKNPKFASGSFGPVDARKNQRQTIAITFTDTNVTKVTATLVTDHNKKSHALTVSPADVRTWTGSWTLTDTYDYIYAVSIDATDKTGASNNLTLTYK